LINKFKEPILREGKFLIYEKPLKGAKYILGVDTAKGTGNNLSSVQVLRVDSWTPLKLEQVAVFYDNTIDVYTFANFINKTSRYYNNAKIMVENNAEGSAIVNRLWWDFENENLINTGSKAVNLGIRATTKTKPQAVLMMKKLIEDGDLTLVDQETINQLADFIEDNNTFKGKDTYDDCVSALYWACYYPLMNQEEESFEFKKDESEDEGWGIITDNDIQENTW